MGAGYARSNGLARTEIIFEKAEGEEEVKLMPMREFNVLLATATMLMTPTVLWAGDQPTAELEALDNALPGTLINDPTRLDWPFFGAGLTAKPIQNDAIPGGKAATQFSVPKAGAALYDTGANAPITAGIKPGTDIVVAFYARTLSAETSDGQARIGVRVQQNEAPYPGFGDTTFVIGKEWKLYELSTKSNVAIAKGKAVVGFQLSGAKQVIEIGQTIVVSGATSLTKKPTVAAQSATTDLLPQLQGKGQLISNPANKDWAFHGSGGVRSTVPSPNIPGTGGSAMLVKTAAPGTNAYDVGASIPITEAIAAGDVLLIAVLARTAPDSSPDGTSKLGIRIQQDEAPYPGFGDNVLTLGPNWRLLQVKTTARSAIPAGKAVLSLHFAAAAQAIEVGQVYVLNSSAPGVAAVPTPQP
jgi:hypothetical protein